ncbi:uncharacterized protein Gasu_02270 [Galdieria sulphuraria]|uniref:Uncharacterized protein n=1 Tax=Galdieria sulphuraria TaxID=130081 RepID=M2WAG7_GALSU|nr:uncharacterized protein Gasu_02270 [Galdieria sulphuraria]EME32876.1 hypothetical protein Gasu_02270 [Galdieria sulphuraria]|eukprot:XP_005709396.1 hypothetical protein Gasu_02270 [Galdieria sulphuraria]
MKVMQEGEVLMAFPHSRNRLLRFYEWLRLTYYRYCLWTAVYVMTTGEQIFVNGIALVVVSLVAYKLLASCLRHYGIYQLLDDLGLTWRTY